MKFKKLRQIVETCGLKQAIDICVAINHLIKVKWEVKIKILLNMLRYQFFFFFWNGLKRKECHINWDEGE